MSCYNINEFHSQVKPILLSFHSGLVDFKVKCWEISKANTTLKGGKAQMQSCLFTLFTSK